MKEHFWMSAVMPSSGLTITNNFQLTMNVYKNIITDPRRRITNTHILSYFCIIQPTAWQKHLPW